MTVKVNNGMISQLSISDAGCSIHLTGSDDSMMLNKNHSSYNSIFSGLLVAASNGFRVGVRFDSDSKTVDYIQLFPEG